MKPPPHPRSRPNPDAVASDVLRSRKYASIDPSLVDAICRLECPKELRPAEALKRVKRKLHQMVGAYLDSDLPFDSWLARLESVPPSEHHTWCREILGHHASTRERLPEMEAVYAAAFEGIPSPTRVADLACGLNPVARPFMPLPPTAVYAAYDVHVGLVRFVGRALGTMGYRVETGSWNLLQDQPPPEADVTLLLKTLPCLEQADSMVTPRLLCHLRSPITVISFPTTSLGGSRRGQALFYRERFLARIPADLYRIEVRELRSELIFRLHRRHAD